MVATARVAEFHDRNPVRQGSDEPGVDEVVYQHQPLPTHPNDGLVHEDLTVLGHRSSGTHRFSSAHGTRRPVMSDARDGVMVVNVESTTHDQSTSTRMRVMAAVAPPVDSRATKR